jgi:hypothetical protein
VSRANRGSLSRGMRGRTLDSCGVGAYVVPQTESRRGSQGEWARSMAGQQGRVEIVNYLDESHSCVHRTVASWVSSRGA